MYIDFLEYATDDIQSINEYISRDSSYFAQKFIAKLMDYTYNLSLFPELGTLVVKQFHVRKLVYRNYLIIYQVNYDSNFIYIIKILHSKQDINIMLNHIQKYIS